MTTWNPRYVAYAKANGKSPEDMIAGQKSMVGFILWISEQVVAFRNENPGAFVGTAIQDNAAFDRFLGILKP